MTGLQVEQVSQGQQGGVGLSQARAQRQPGRCSFCPAPVAPGRVTCGGEACTKAYYRAWHRDAQRTHPERYGDAFYAARGRGRPPRVRGGPTRETSSPRPVSGLHPIGSVYLQGAPVPARKPEPPARRPVPLDDELWSKSAPAPSQPAPARKGHRVARLAELHGEVNSDVLMAEMAMSRDAANQLLSRLAADGTLVRVGSGTYALPGGER